MSEPALTERTYRRQTRELDFAGCDPVSATEAQILGPEWENRRLEYWDALSETAWVAREPATPYHEGPTRKLGMLVTLVCQARGADARCFGTTDLRMRRDDGALTDIMQPDETVYLYPAEARLPGPHHLIIGEHDYPDVVLEVDNTTDVRRGKLLAYQDWGFPEVWVEVPDLGSAGRSRGRRPGLTIHLLEEHGYRESPESRAFPGWRAEEIHRALNENIMTEETADVLWRVGQALGKRDGTSADDDFLLSKFGRRKQARAMAEMAASILRRRGIAVPVERIEERILAVAGRGVADRVVEAALDAHDERDLVRRLG